MYMSTKIELEINDLVLKRNELALEIERLNKRLLAESMAVDPQWLSKVDNNSVEDSEQFELTEFKTQIGQVIEFPTQVEIKTDYKTLLDDLSTNDVQGMLNSLGRKQYGKRVV